MVERPIKKSERQNLAATSDTKPVDAKSDAKSGETDSPVSRETPRPSQPLRKKDKDSRDKDSRDKDSRDRDAKRGKKKGGRRDDEAPRPPVNPALMRGPKPTAAKPPQPEPEPTPEGASDEPTVEPTDELSSGSEASSGESTEPTDTSPES